MKMELERVLKEYERLPEYLGMGAINIFSRSLFGNFPLNIAAARGSSEEVLTILDAGADINMRGESGFTPLHDAVEQNHREVVEILSERGARRDIKNDDGVDPEELCKVLQHKSLIDLVSKGHT